MLQIGSSNLGQISSGTVTTFAVREDYIIGGNLFYLGYGYATTLDSHIITIKRVTITPSTGAVAEAYATDTWTNHLTATYL